MSNPSQTRRGEGFAFLCWARCRWPQYTKAPGREVNRVLLNIWNWGFIK